MSEIIINPEYKELQDEYNMLKSQVAAVIEERDDLIYHKTPVIKTDYMMKIGRLEYDLFEMECGIARARRKIEMIQACINLQVPVIVGQIEAQLDKEYEDYMDKLRKMADEIDIANFLSKCEKLTGEETRELKKLYRAAAKLLHPDMRQDVAEGQKLLWNRVVAAYEDGNIEMLKVLYELALEDKTDDNEKCKDDDSIDKIKGKIELLHRKMRDLFSDIDRIKKSFPFNFEEFLEDDVKVENRRNELRESIKEDRKIMEELKNYLQMMIPGESTYMN